MSPRGEAEHGLVVKTLWKNSAARLRESLRNSQRDAEGQAAEARDVFAIRAGIEAYVARAALDLVDEILEAATAAQGALPIRLMFGQHLVLDGKVWKVLDASADDDAAKDGRRRWDVVTDDKLGQRWGAEKAEGQPSGADATVELKPWEKDLVSSCAKCLKPFDPADTSFEGRAQERGTPFCRECVSRCHNTEIADHWCKIDDYRLGREAASAAE